MIEPPDRERLEHILAACREIREFLDGVGRSDFTESPLLQRAVEKDLEIIGEAASNLSPETRTDLSSIPWKDIIGMRNILIHVYFDVEVETVWQTVQNDLPELRSKIKQVLNRPSD
jgi:uncharacterized protein with HEPN domain